MKLPNRPNNTVVVGFDSAWEDKNPGAICSIDFDESGNAEFTKPRPASFDQACEFIKTKQQRFDVNLVAIDQPILVPNLTGSRPVDRAAGSFLWYMNGGAHSANRGMGERFGDDAPIWRFCDSIDHIQEPMQARIARSGNFLIEVFPALALASMNDAFAEPNGAPKYDPDKTKNYRYGHWRAVTSVVNEFATAFEVGDLADWASGMRDRTDPTKGDQDMLDASICALTGLMWRAGPPESLAMLGDTTSGYMVTPVSFKTRNMLAQAARKKCVPIELGPNS